MVYDKAKELADALRSSDEYKEFKAARDVAFANETTKTLIKEMHTLQVKAQAVMVAGERDDETMMKLQKMGELLQMNKDAATYLMAEFRLNRTLGDIYKMLAEAVDTDLDMLRDR